MLRDKILLITIGQIPIVLFFWGQVDGYYAEFSFNILFLFFLNTIVFIFGALVPKVVIFKYTPKNLSFWLKTFLSCAISLLLISLTVSTHLDKGNLLLLPIANMLLLLLFCLIERRSATTNN